MGTTIGLRADYRGRNSGRRRKHRVIRAGCDVFCVSALAAIYDGASGGDAASVGGVDLQTLRDWVVWFNGERPDSLIDGKAPGR